MKRNDVNAAPGALEILERGTALLRGAPLRAWAAYALGTLPFALGLLYFWAEMSHGAFARRHCLAQSVALACLFVWMKCWHSLFCLALRDHLTGAAPTRWTAARTLRLIAVQGATQPWGLFLLPIGLVLVAPFGWLYAFFQNLTVLGDEPGEIRAAARKAGGLAALWPGNNHVILLILLVFSLFVWLNVMITICLVPPMLKTLLGIETVFTQGGLGAYLNSTTLAASFLITYFCVDPVSKAAYLLRCFHGMSLASGEDLKVELDGIRRAAGWVAVALVVSGALTAAGADATEAPNTRSEPPAHAPAIPVSELNQSIEKALARDEFTWRMPREQTETKDSEMSWFARFVEDTALAIRETVKWLRKASDAVEKWLRRLSPAEKPDRETGGGNGSIDWPQMLRVVVAVLITAICCLIAILIMRTRRRRRGEVVAAEAMAALPDLEDEDVAASHLPEEGWLKLAREMVEKGELRLALRAYYLGSLAHLAGREMIAIAKFKSNREYEAELRWRHRALTELHRAFSENGGIFDRVWYGMHEVTQEVLGQFQSNVERIRAC